ncbi:hypothetical protein CJF31_00011512 [Rutstroemia sp. NJR-2017a BVV2]|nr:hypothetical protein CJF31_00011512 [Rutstroemia sp. NJR-2017a BVV2]
MADDLSAWVNRAFGEAQKVAQHVIDTAPSAYERGKEAAITSAAKLRPKLDAAIEKAPAVIAASKEAAGNLYDNAPTILRDGRTTGLDLLRRSKPAMQSTVETLTKGINQHPYISAWIAMSVVFGPLWPLRILLKILGFGKGGVDRGMLHSSVLIAPQRNELTKLSRIKSSDSPISCWKCLFWLVVLFFSITG